MSEEKWGNQTLPGLTEEELLNPYVNNIVTCKKLAKDPEWIEKCKQVRDGDQWKNSQKVAGKKRKNSQDFHEKQKEGAKKWAESEKAKTYFKERSKNENWLKITSERMKSEEHKKKIRKKEGVPHHRAKYKTIGVHITTKERVEYIGIIEIAAAGHCRVRIGQSIEANKPYHDYMWHKELL